MGTIYAKRGTLYVGYKGIAGNWTYGATEFKVRQEAQARKFLDTVERRVKAALEMAAATLGPVTVNRYAERWIKDRRDRRIGSARDDETRLRRHALPQLGELVLAKVRPSHLRALIRSLKAKVGQDRKQLALRTVRHVYGVLHRMFEDAVADELIASNPCAIKRGELPAKIDKDPTWRSSAVFTREEVERLISDEEIPEERRVLYALLFLTGMGIGEVAALRWRAYANSSKPLGRLLVATSFNRKKKAEKSVKTDRPREVPVHPTLAKVLAGWKLSGWQKLMARAPNADDLLICTADGNHLKDNLVYDAFQRDLGLTGLRARRVHDARRYAAFGISDAHSSVFRLRMEPEKTSCDGLPTGPKATSSASTPRCFGTRFVPRLRSYGLSYAPANCGRRGRRRWVQRGFRLAVGRPSGRARDGDAEARSTTMHSKREKPGDLFEGESDFLRGADEAHSLRDRRSVLAVTRRAAARLREDPFALVESDGLSAHTRGTGQLPNGHVWHARA